MVVKERRFLEDVQRRSTELVNCHRDTKYEDRVELLNPDSLSCRVDKNDMIFAYKILHGFLEDIQWRSLFQLVDTSRLRGHYLKLKK